MTGKEVLHQRDRPLFKRLGEDGMVSVAKGLLYNYKLLAHLRS